MAGIRADPVAVTRARLLRVMDETSAMLSCRNLHGCGQHKLSNPGHFALRQQPPTYQKGIIMANIKKPLAAALGAAFLASSIAPLASAAVNPFSPQQLSGGYDLPNFDKAPEGKCGEGKCGEKRAANEGKCGGAADKAGEGNCGEKMKEGSCGEKMKEGSCGGKADKAKEGSCGDKAGTKAGEGKCGGS